MASKDKDPNIRINAEDKTGKAFKSAQDRMRNLASSAAILEGPLGKVAGRINAMGAALGRMNPLMVVGSVTIASFGVGIFTTAKAAAELEQQMLRLDAVLKATGRTGETSLEQINVFARELGETTLTSAEAVRGATAALATFKNIGTDQMEEVLILAQDMSAVFGGDLRANSIKLARALDNPREGLTGLSRNILATSSAWRNYNADLFESGKTMEAQSQIITAIKEKVAGAGTAEAGGLVGSVDTLGERWTRAMENLGDTLPMNLAGLAVDGLSGSLRILNEWLEADATAQSKFARLIEPNIFLIERYGVSLGNLSEDTLTLREVNEVIKQMTELGIDLAEEAPYTKISAQIVAFTEHIRDLDAERVVLEITGSKESARYKELTVLIGDSEVKIRELVDAYAALSVVKEKDAELSAILQEKADKLIDKFTKKSQTQVEQARDNLLGMQVALSKAGEEGAAKYAELHAAYIAFITKLNDEANEKAQKRVDKAVSIEEDKVARIKAVLLRAQAESGFTGPEQFDGGKLQSQKDLIEQQIALDIEAADRRFALLVKQGKDTTEQWALIEAEKLLITQTGEERKRVLWEQSAQAEIDAKRAAAGHVQGLLAALGKENKIAALAALALSKGLSIAEVINNTEVAAMRALADLGPIAGAPVAAGIRAAGAVSVGAIAATGLLDAASINVSSGNLGTGGGRTSFGPEPPELSSTKDRPTVLLQFQGDVYGWDQFMEDRVISSIQKAVDEKDLIIIGPNSRNAQEITS
jgi:hypothetical protein